MLCTRDCRCRHVVQGCGGWELDLAVQGVVVLWFGFPESKESLVNLKLKSCRFVSIECIRWFSKPLVGLLWSYLGPDIIQKFV